MKTGKQRAAKLLLKWIPRLGLGEWDITLCEKAVADREDSTCAFETTAEINADAIYSIAKLYIYPAFAQRSPGDQEETIVHELLHCLVSGMERLVTEQRQGQLITPMEADKENERLTQALTNALLEAYGGRK